MGMGRDSNSILQIRLEGKRDMVRQKHGNYDADRGLPDNRMQPVGSGLAVWLQEQIIALIGKDQAQDLIDQAATRGLHRYKYMLQQMTERGYDDLEQRYEERPGRSRRSGDCRQRSLRSSDCGSKWTVKQARPGVSIFAGR